MDIKIFSEQETQARNTFRSMLETHQWLMDLDRLARGVTLINGSARTRYRKLVQLADRVNMAVADFSPCSGGCSFCCTKAVAVAEHEASLISETIGIPLPLASKEHLAMVDVEDEHFRGDCPFLCAGRCSVYETRPIACRVKFSLATLAEVCDSRNMPDGLAVPSMSMNPFWMALAAIFPGARIADIREFFPERRGVNGK